MCVMEKISNKRWEEAPGNEMEGLSEGNGIQFWVHTGNAK